MAPQSTLSNSVDALDWTLTFPSRLWTQLQLHLFPGDGDEHGAVVLAGLAKGRNGDRLLAKDLILAIDGRDYVAGEHGYRALTPIFIARAAQRARDLKLAYLAVHCHGGTGQVAFSEIDLASHERGYPAIQQITGQIVGGVVIAQQAAAGDLWIRPGKRVALTSVLVPGGNFLTFAPRPTRAPDDNNPTFDRQARLFGLRGQQRLGSMRVAIVGLGGAGSIAAELLARLGVGQLLLIDPDQLEQSNLSRVLGSRHSDLRHQSTHGRLWSLLMRQRMPMLKVDIAAREIRRSGLPVKTFALPLNVAHPRAAGELALCDWIVLAADTQYARLLVNAIVHAFLIPAVQIGVKIPADQTSGVVGDIFVVARRISPDSGCLWCNALIDSTELQLEALGDQGRAARAYVGPDAPAPSVVTMNGLAASMATTDFLLATMGLYEGPLAEQGPGYIRTHVRAGMQYLDHPRRDRDCPYCGDNDSMLSLGNAASIPTFPTPRRDPTHQLR